MSAEKDKVSAVASNVESQRAQTDDLGNLVNNRAPS